MTITAATGSSPLPTMNSTDLVGVLQQLVSTLSQLVQTLQAQATATATGGGAGAGVAQLASPMQSSPPATGGCGCGGAAGAIGGAAGAPRSTSLAETRARVAAAPVPGRPPSAAAPTTPPFPPTPGVTAAKGSRQYNAQVIAKVAREYGVDPVLAVADAIHESNLNAGNATGDGGTSFGLYQLHVNGELPADWNPGAPNHAKAFDPEANARIALARFRDLKGKYSGGELAFHAERPANEGAYVKAVEANYDEARRLLAS